MFEYIWILLPLGLIIGWYAAKIDSSHKRKLHQYLSLRYYLEKEREIDKDLPTNDSSIPLNIEDEGINFTLTLGDAYRRRGEVDKAIELHEHLLGSLSIDDTNRPKVLISLSQDYSIAGIFDRSENTLRELLSTPHHDFAALKLANLYKQQNDWLQAVSMYERIDQHKELYAMEVAHLYCELAEQSIHDSNLTQAIFWSDQALNMCPHIARSHLIKAFIALQSKQYTEAIHQLSLLSKQQPSLIALIIPIAYQSMMIENNQLFYAWLEKNIEKHESFFYLKIWKTHFLVLNQSVEHAIKYLKSALEQTKNLQGITLLNHLSALENKPNHELLMLYHTTFQQVIDYYAQFRCEKCGFISKTLQWHCPSCQSWNTVSPVSDIIALQK